jgi:membrane-bound serine protease (ClpP class)
VKTKILFLLFILLSQMGLSQNRVYVGYIDSDIDLGLTPYIRRVISEAEENNAAAVIFKVNTFGGRVDAATQIKDAIMNTDLLTIAFINNRAISAGALIAISCNRIAIAPGGAIGAATVVDQTGEKVGEKYQSYMRSEMRATAEKNGRRTDVAQGMVDERVIIEGLVDSTQLITLTSGEAIKFGMADTVVSNINDALAAFGIDKAEIIYVEPNWAEGVVKFLNNPIIASLLIMMGLVGLFAEVKTPGWGVPGTAALISLSLFFGSSYILQLASIGEILLFLGGLILLGVEIFVVPGFGVAGILGILMIIVSLFLSLIGTTPFWDITDVSIAIIQLSGALILSFIMIALMAKYLPKTSFFNRLVLSEEETVEKGFVSYPSEKELIGVVGTALTTLRPAGSAELNGKRVDVIADWEYIEKGTKVKVIRVEGVKVVVTTVKENE